MADRLVPPPSHTFPNATTPPDPDELQGAFTFRLGGPMSLVAALARCGYRLRNSRLPVSAKIVTI